MANEPFPGPNLFPGFSPGLRVSAWKNPRYWAAGISVAVIAAVIALFIVGVL